jgi:hypothetical protein
MDKIAAAVFIFGLGSTAVTMAFQAKYPNAKKWVVELLWWGGIVLILLSGVYLLYSKFDGCEG